ncbi:MAG: DNA alkylation repair protein [Luteolibacter sp.]
MIPEHILNRTGARNTASVPKDVLTLLNQGKIESVNLCEWLVIDQLALAKAVFKTLSWENHIPALEAFFSEKSPKTAPKKIATIGKFLTGIFTTPASIRAASEKLLTQPSDSPRSWGAYLVGLSPYLSIAEKFHLIRPYATDTNKSVPEIAWLALREVFIANIEETFEILTPFTHEKHGHLRRFASELTRPRGVWCRHVQALKENPAPGIKLLEPLKSDPSNYVRLSVGNWLNDASKTTPDIVRETCARWQNQSPTKQTTHITRRALRTIDK